MTDTDGILSELEPLSLGGGKRALGRWRLEVHLADISVQHPASETLIVATSLLQITKSRVVLPARMLSNPCRKFRAGSDPMPAPLNFQNGAYGVLAVACFQMLDCR